MATTKKSAKKSAAKKSPTKSGKKSATPPAKRWSAKVTTDSTKPGPGLFKKSAKVIAEGGLPSGRRHFIDDGYFEGRLPFPIKVDEQWYLAQNPDVAEDVRKGVIASGQAHFDAFGYCEGRLPFPL